MGAGQHAHEITQIHRGEILRIDRLVRERASGACRVFDCKSAARPEHDEALLVQPRRCRDTEAYPANRVRVAFLTGQGQLIELAKYMYIYVSNL